MPTFMVGKFYQIQKIAFAAFTFFYMLIRHTFIILSVFLFFVSFLLGRNTSDISPTAIVLLQSKL